METSIREASAEYDGFKSDRYLDWWEITESEYNDLLIMRPIKWNFDAEYKELNLEEREFISRPGNVIYCLENIQAAGNVIYCLENIQAADWLEDGF